MSCLQTHSESVVVIAVHEFVPPRQKYLYKDEKRDDYASENYTKTTLNSRNKGQNNILFLDFKGIFCILLIWRF